MARSPADRAAVSADGLTIGYGERVAISRASFTVPAGELTAVIGPNGSGKTSLLRAMSGLLTPRSGKIEVLGRRPSSNHGTVAHVLQSQTFNQAVPVTVLETVRMGRYAVRGAFGRLRSEDHEAVDEAIDRMGIADLVGRQLPELSGGQRQRVFVAQGLAQRADLLLLDEPITGLDISSMERIEQAVAAELAAGRTVVLTTHDVAAAARADHVLLVATHIVAAGAPEDVLTEDHLGHAYGAKAFRTADGALVIGDPHVHGAVVTGHEDH